MMKWPSASAPITDSEILHNEVSPISVGLLVDMVQH
jgi:hypothetical protein